MHLLGAYCEIPGDIEGLYKRKRVILKRFINDLIYKVLLFLPAVNIYNLGLNIGCSPIGFL